MSSAADTFLETAFRIRRGEARRAGLMFLYQLAIVATFIVGRTVRDTLFLSRYPLSRLPLMYVAVAVAVAAASYTYSRFADRYPRERVILASLLLSAAALSLAWLGVATEVAGRWLYPALYLLVEIIGALSMIQFWTFANDLFSAREAKRLFAFIGAGGVLASIACGFAIGGSAQQLGAPNLILIATALLVLAAVCVGAIVKECSAELAAARREPRGKVQESAGRTPLLPSKHLRLIAAMVCVTMLTSTIVDYQFKVVAQQSFQGREEALAAYFGWFYGFAGLISFVVQFFVLGRLLERAGVVWALLVLPLGLFAGAAAMVAAPLIPALIAATAAKGAENVFRYTVNDAAMQLLYVPVQSRQRARAKAFIDGVIKPVSVGLSGLAILALGKLAGSGSQALGFALQLGWADAALISGWIFFILAVRSEYLRTLLGTLRARRLDFDTPFSLAADGASVKVLEHALTSRRETDVLHALELLPSLSIAPGAKVRSLIDHPSAEVRVAVLHLLEKSRTEDCLELIRSRFSEEDPAVRSAAVHAFCVLGKLQAVEPVLPFLADPSPVVRGAAVAGLMRASGPEGARASAAALAALLGGADPAERIEGARAVERAALHQHWGAIETLLRDPELEVRLAAIRAAGAMKRIELAPVLITMLASARTAPAAARALAAYGPTLHPLLLEVLRREDEPAAIRRELPKILAQHGGEELLHALLELTGATDGPVLEAIARAASRLRERLGPVVIDETPLIAATRRQLHEAYRDLAIALDLGLGSDDLLTEALFLRHERRLSLVFQLLAVRFTSRTLELVWANLRSQDRARRANAIEVIDTIVPGEESRLLLPLLEARELEHRVQAGAESFVLERLDRARWLVRLARSEDPWIASCALFHLGQQGAPGSEPAVVERLATPEPLVRETACRALARLWAGGKTPEPASVAVVQRVLAADRSGAEAEPAMQSALDTLRDALEKRTAHG